MPKNKGKDKASKKGEWMNSDEWGFYKWINKKFSEFKQEKPSYRDDIDIQKDYCEKLSKKEEFALQKHQKFVTEYMRILDNSQNPDVRGLLLYHGLGSGKTCSAISIAMALGLKGNQPRDIIVMTPASLKNNFISEIDKCGHEDLKSKIKYITTNASNTKKQIEQQDLNNKLIIVDEVHNSISMMVNTTTNGAFIYNKFMDAQNSRFIFLSGTPMVNNSYEIATLINILRGKMINSSGQVVTSFPEDVDIYQREWLEKDDINSQIKSEKLHIYKSKFRGLISHYSSSEEYMPELIKHPIIYLRMSKYQEPSYREEREKELKKERGGKGKKRILGLESEKSSVSSYKIHTRLISNFVFPYKKLENGSEPSVKIERPKNSGDDNYNDLLKNAVERIPDEYLQEQDNPNTLGLNDLSPKMNAMIKIIKGKSVISTEIDTEETKIESHGRKHKILVYSSFLKAEGLGIFKKVLDINGFSEYKFNDEYREPKQRYILYT